MTVRNEGSADAGGFWITVLIDGEKLGARFVGGLPCGEKVTVKFEWTFLHSGKYVITAIADSGEEEVII